jgi:hypothetical protein
VTAWRGRHWALVGAVAFLAGSIAFAPAWLVGVGVQRFTDLPVRFTNAAGTVWHGAADTYLLHGDSVDPLGRLQWRFRPARLLRGEISAALSLRHGETRLDGIVASTGNTVALNTLTGNVVLASYRSAVQHWLPLVPDGTVQLAASKLVLSRDAADGLLAVTLTDIAIPGVTASPLGSYAVDMKFADSAVAIDARTLRGGLQLSGSGQWQAFDSGRYEFTLTARNTTGSSLIDNIMTGVGLEPGRPTKFEGVRLLN